ncbi:hypothetical protein D3C73_1359860 [compost metagenome]
MDGSIPIDKTVASAGFAELAGAAVAVPAFSLPLFPEPQAESSDPVSASAARGSMYFRPADDALFLVLKLFICSAILRHPSMVQMPVQAQIMPFYTRSLILYIFKFD